MFVFTLFEANGAISKNCIFGENLEHFVQYPIPHMCAFILVVAVVVVYVVGAA